MSDLPSHHSATLALHKQTAAAPVDRQRNENSKHINNNSSNIATSGGAPSPNKSPKIAASFISLQRRSIVNHLDDPLTPSSVSTDSPRSWWKSKSSPVSSPTHQQQHGALHQAPTTSTLSTAQRGNTTPHRSINRSHHRSLLERIMSKVRFSLSGFLMFDQVRLSAIYVWFLAYCYMPIIGLLLAFTMNASLVLFLMMIIPLIDHSSSSKEMPTVQELLRLCLPHQALLLCVAVVFYKTMTNVSMAMIDSVLIVSDQDTGLDVYFYLLLYNLRQIWARTTLRWIFISVLSLIVALFVWFAAFKAHEIMDEPNVVYLTVASIVVQATWLTVHLLRIPKSITADSFSRWWSSKIPKMRRRGLLVVAVASAFAVHEAGIMYGVAVFIEGSIYFNFPQIILHWLSSILLFGDKLIRSAQTCALPRHREPVIVAVVPIVAFAAYTFSMVKSTYSALLIIPTLLNLFASLGSLLQEADFSPSTTPALTSPVSESPPSTAKQTQKRQQGKAKMEPHKQIAQWLSHKYCLLLNKFSWYTNLLTRLYLCHTKKHAHATPHFKAGLMIRVLLRMAIVLVFVILALLFILVVGQMTTRRLHAMERHMQNSSCELVERTSEFTKIRVRTKSIVANLIGWEKGSEGDKARTRRLDEAHPYLHDYYRHEGLCHRKWYGKVYAGDLAFFALMAYYNEKTPDFHVMLDFFRRYRDDAHDWELLPHSLQKQHKKGRKQSHSEDEVFIHHFYSKSKNLSVIAVRGTDVDSAADLLQNTIVFSESFIFQLIAMLIPFSGLLPEKVITGFIYIASSSQRLAEGTKVIQNHEYFATVVDYVTRMRATEEYGKVILVGHSLGGALAHLAGTHTGSPSLGFASPGIMMIRKKYSIPADVIDALTTNIVASNDMITRIDKAGGTVHQIQCEHTRTDLCHSMELHTIRLWTTCHPYRYGTRFDGGYSLLPRFHNALLNDINDVLSFFF